MPTALSVTATCFAMALSCCLTGCGADALGDARRAFAADDRATAFSLYAQVAGEDDIEAAMTAGDLCALALCALEAGDDPAVQSAVERAAARAGAPGYVFRDLLLGVVAWRRADLAARQARGPEAGPEAWALALRQAESAHALFVRAAERGDAQRPLAVRNAERAWLLLQKVREDKAEADAERAAKARARRDAMKKDPQGDPLVIDLPDYLARLLETLQKRDEAKQAERDARAASGASDVERDW